MKRRNFLKVSSLLGAGACMPMSLYTLGQGLGESSAYTGRLLVTVQAKGGWDVTSFCDPKANVTGESEINRWSRTSEVQQAGNILYAPFGGNARLFNDYHKYMMVINGVDAQTNSHTVGIVNNWSGRVADGYPSLPAIFSSSYAAELPLSYINNGGFGQTSKLIRYSRMDDSSALVNLLNPNRAEWDPNVANLTDSSFSRLQAYRKQRGQMLATESAITSRMQYNRDAYLQSLVQSESLAGFAANIPSENQLQPSVNIGGRDQNYMRQIQLAMIAFQSGVASAADLMLDGFDTHAGHDAEQSSIMTHLTDGIVYLWEYAEQLGLADRLTVVIGSDFGRTPYYNSEDGKDHWPIGSVIVMEKNAPWGNRVVGLTDEGHNAVKINPSTLGRDDANGTIIYPSHVHKALRTYLGLDNLPNVGSFPFQATETFDFFNPNLMTAG